MIKKADVLLAVFILAAGILSAVGLAFGGGAGEVARITVDGREYGVYDLTEDQTITVESNGHFNIVTISGGQVSVTDADCPDKLCIRQGPAGRTNQSIVCLPNRMVIEVTGPDSGGADAYSS